MKVSRNFHISLETISSHRQRAIERDPDLANGRFSSFYKDWMKILLLMDPLIPVPPRHYGGIERVIADLANGFSDRGHEVDLWAAPGSQTAARLSPFGREGEWTSLSNLRNLAVVTARLLKKVRQYDLVHNFGKLAYFTSILHRDVPKIQTYMRPVNPNNMVKARLLGAWRLHYTAVSAAIRDTGISGGGSWTVIYNCAPANEYTLNTQVDPASAPLAFLGRLERCKGVHNAIRVAKALGRQLKIAGNVSDLPHEKEYFQQEIEPEIDDRLINYIGPVNNEEKNKFLGEAAALLMPIEFEEPFPVVLPEALLCGCPVIAFARGGVPEGIDHGKSGFICSTVEEMCELVSRLGEIDRSYCRREAERRFSSDVIVSAYESLYHEMIEDRFGVCAN